MSMLHEHTIEEMSDVLLSEYSEVTLIDRIFTTSNDKYIAWIKSCEDIEQLKLFRRNMAIVVNRKLKGTTRNNAILWIGYFVATLAVSIAASNAASNVAGAATANSGKLVQAVAKAGADGATGYAVGAVSNDMKSSWDARDTVRFTPLLVEVDNRINYLTSLKKTGK